MITPDTLQLYKPWNPPFVYRKDFQDIVDSKENKILDVRGWGFLTGRGSLAMDDDAAELVQDGIGTHVAYLMNQDAKLNGYRFQL